MTDTSKPNDPTQEAARKFQAEREHVAERAKESGSPPDVADAARDAWPQPPK